MSVLRYTFTSSVLQQEVTAILTVPEASVHEKRPFATAVLLPDTGKQSDYLLRTEALERSCGSDLATVSLAGQIALLASPPLIDFLTLELPNVLAQFPLHLCALYANGASAALLAKLTDKLCTVYPTTQWGGCLETFLTQLKPKEGIA